MQFFRVIKKFSKILSSHQKFRIFELAFLMIVGGFLEMLSVSIMLPFVAAIMNPDEILDKWYVKIFCNILNLHSVKSFLIALSITFAVLYVVKNFYLICESRIQNKFVYNNMFAMESKLLDNFLRRPYEYYLNVNSSEIIRIINNDTTITFQLLSTLLGIFTETVVSIVVIGTIFFIAPEITIFVAVVLVALLLTINVFLKPMLGKAGKINQQTYTGLNKWLLQSIHGIKEIKVMRKESYFQENFDINGKKVANTLRNKNFLESVPKTMIEAVSMSAIFLMIAFMVYRDQNIETMIPVLTAIAMAAIRLLPSVNRISSALGNVAYSEPMLDQLIENLKKIQGDDNITLSGVKTNEDVETEQKRLITGLKGKIEISGISYKYPGGHEDILSDASMIIEKGDSIGIVGMSGAGKTTTVDIILGLLHPQRGEIRIDGIDIREDRPGWLSQIGYIPQTIFMLDSSIRSNVAFGISEGQISDDDVWRALQEASLDEYVKTLPKGLDTEIGERGIRLSGGQRQRIGIARALYQNPSILIMDEATSALDNETEKDIMRAINYLQGKKTMIIIAHRLTTLDSCNHIYRVDNKKIVKER